MMLLPMLVVLGIAIPVDPLRTSTTVFASCGTPCARLACMPTSAQVQISDIAELLLTRMVISAAHIPHNAYTNTTTK